MVNKIKNQEKFESFVEFHNKCKKKRHLQGDKFYSDYDTMLGMSIIMIPLGFIFVNPFIGTLAISLTIIFLLLNNTEITKKEGKSGNPSSHSTKKFRQQ